MLCGEAPLSCGVSNPRSRTGRGGRRGRAVMTTPGTRAWLTELEAVVEENLARHLASAEDWMPHEYVPWSEGRSFEVLGGEQWSIEQSKLSPIARTALE